MQPMTGPGFRLAVALRAEPVAIERIAIDARAYRYARLESLVAGTGSRTGPILSGVHRLGAGDGGLDTGVSCSEAKPDLERIAENFEHAPISAVTQPHHAHHRRSQPGRGRPANRPTPPPQAPAHQRRGGWASAALGLGG